MWKWWQISAHWIKNAHQVPYPFICPYKTPLLVSFLYRFLQNRWLTVPEWKAVLSDYSLKLFTQLIPAFVKPAATSRSSADKVDVQVISKRRQRWRGGDRLKIEKKNGRLSYCSNIFIRFHGGPTIVYSGNSNIYSCSHVYTVCRNRCCCITWGFVSIQNQSWTC